jgi:pimeloyl-ACP methyl ester carboxylesterase
MTGSGADRLFATRLGDSGPRVVFLHGLFGQGKNWTTVAKALATDSRVTLVDLPDHGRSPWSSRFSYAEMARAVADLIRTDDDPPVALVGHSMGGKVAMTLALRQPKLVDRLAVVDVSPVRYRRLSSFADYVAAMRALDLASLPDRAAADAALRPFVGDDMVRGFLLQNLRRDPAGGGWRWQLNLELLGNHLEELADWPDAAAPPYPGPVLWVAGDRSDYVTPAYVEAMRALFPRAQLVRVKNAGHWVHAERPDVFVAALRRFLHPSSAEHGIV